MEEVDIANESLKVAHDARERDYKTFVESLTREEKRLKQRLDDLEKRKLEAAQAYGDGDASGDDLVEINAGGKLIAAKRATLTEIEGSRLEGLFSGRWDKKVERDGKGRIFLDVNPLCFQAMVDYLNEMEISTTEDPPEPICVDEEYRQILMEYLEMFGVSRIMMGEGLLDSCIIRKCSHVERLHEWLREDNVDGQFNLLYRSSRDGGSAIEFHSKCDDKGSTLVVVKTTDGIVFGAFTGRRTSSHQGLMRPGKLFLFVLQAAGISSPSKIKPKNSEYRARPRCLIFGSVLGIHFQLFSSQAWIHISDCCEIDPSLGRQINGLHTIEEVEAFQVEVSPNDIKSTNDRKRKRSEEPAQCPNAMSIRETTSFTSDINNALNAKLKALRKVERKAIKMEEKFKDEENFISTFASGETKDVMCLNVSGTMMSTNRSTLQIIDDSVLARQFDDSTWTEQGCEIHRMKEWTAEDVSAWVKNIEGISADVGKNFKENEITGRELLALGKEGLEAIGVTRAGTVFLLLDEIKKLERASQDVVTLIEHSPYCFEKILDFLRLKRLHSLNLVDEPDLPHVRDSEKSRFKKVVQYYFPGDISKSILG